LRSWEIFAFCVLCCLFFVSLLFVKIDKDGDGLVSPAELQSWMRHVQQQSLDTETDKQWSELNPKDPNLLTWEEYIQHTYKDDRGLYYSCFKYCMFIS